MTDKNPFFSKKRIIHNQKLIVFLLIILCFWSPLILAGFCIYFMVAVPFIVPFAVVAEIGAIISVSIVDLLRWKEKRKIGE